MRSWLQPGTSWHSPCQGQMLPPLLLRPAGESRHVSVDADDGIRPDSTQQKLGALKPYFKKAGTVTAGNTCQVSGAWALGPAPGSECSA